VNELLLANGRSLDKITQAETLESYPGLSRDLAKLTASQYLAELTLCQALSDQPQEELFWLLCEHLARLERSPTATVLAYLAHAIFHLLAWAGIAPQVQACCITQHCLIPDFTDPNWRVGFSESAGGVVSLAELEASEEPALTRFRPSLVVAASNLKRPSTTNHHRLGKQCVRLSAMELQLLQQLAQPDLLRVGEPLADAQSSEDLDVFKQCSSQSAWLSVERALRQYAQYHFDRPIRSAALMDTCFHPLHLPL
jgi:DNA repair protein RecO (recombination protein O)